MPATSLDSKTALVVIDLQKWTSKVPTAHPFRDVLSNAVRLAEAFRGTELDLQLRRRHVTGIVLAGVSASIGVDSTARAALERSYRVIFASDAMTDVDAEAHEFVMKKIFPRIGEIDSTDALLALMREKNR